MEQKSIKKNYQEFKNNFDTIINAKAPEDDRPRGTRTKQTARKSTAGVPPPPMAPGAAPMRMMAMERSRGGGGM